MRILSEAIRWMSDVEPPSAETLLNQAINTVLWADGNGAGEELSDLTLSLCRAYEAAMVREGDDDGDDPELHRLEPRDAERVMQKAFVRAMCRTFKGYSAENAMECFTWPECLPFTAHYESGLVIATGNALGYRCAVQTQAGFAYMQRVNAEPESAAEQD